jgi:hypothetical protein
MAAWLCPPNWGRDMRRAQGNAQGVPPPVHVAGTRSNRPGGPLTAPGPSRSSWAADPINS